MSQRMDKEKGHNESDYTGSDSFNKANRIYETENCIGLQLDSKNMFLLAFFGHEVELKPCSLISFRDKVQKIDLEALLCTDATADLEVVKFGCIDRLFVFTIREIIELKEFLDGVMTMLALNSLIHSRLVRL